MATVSDKAIEYLWNDELSDREVHFIGKVIVQWGALEHEIFTQTLLTFEVPEDEQIVLPRAMNNLQFSEMLDLWKERVVDIAEGKRSEVLRVQRDDILRLKPFRDAIVHGRWDWSASDLSSISTVRVRKKEMHTVQFTAADLEDFYRQLARINFKIRCPGGIEDLASQRTASGGYMSRRFLSMITGNAIADDWLSRSSPSTRRESEEPDA